MPELTEEIKNKLLKVKYCETVGYGCGFAVEKTYILAKYERHLYETLGGREPTAAIKRNFLKKPRK